MPDNHRRTFEEAPNDIKLLMLYDKICDVGGGLKTHTELQISTCEIKANKCDKRFKKIEGMSMINTSVSAISGFVGGATAVIAKYLFWKT